MNKKSKINAGATLLKIAAKTGESVIEIGSSLSMMGIKSLLTESGGKYYLSK